MKQLNTFDDLFYCNTGQRLRLPGWAKFHLKVGSIIRPQTNGKIRIALALPTRQYAAAFSAFGFVASEISLENNEISPQDYFQYLCGLENETSVSFIKDGRKKEGELCGCETIYNEPRLKVRVHNKSAGGLTHFVSIKDVFNIEVLSNKIAQLPKKQTGKAVRSLTLFAELLSNRNSLPFDKQTHNKTVILGHRSTLKKEITGINLALKIDEQKFAEGTLQDVLRVHEYQNINEHFLSRVISGYRASINTTVKNLKPDLLVFDGAIPFLRWRDCFRESNWLIILDKSESNFRDATVIINQEYAKYGKNVSGLNNLPVPGDGVDIIHYYEPVY